MSFIFKEPSLAMLAGRLDRLCSETHPRTALIINPLGTLLGFDNRRICRALARLSRRRKFGKTVKLIHQELFESWRLMHDLTCGDQDPEDFCEMVAECFRIDEPHSRIRQAFTLAFDRQLHGTYRVIAELLPRLRFVGLVANGNPMQAWHVRWAHPELFLMSDAVWWSFRMGSRLPAKDLLNAIGQHWMVRGWSGDTIYVSDHDEEVRAAVATIPRCVGIVYTGLWTSRGLLTIV